LKPRTPLLIQQQPIRLRFANQLLPISSLQDSTQIMPFEIRPYAQEDYPQLVSILADEKPSATTSAEMLPYRDQTHPS
jgi:hypothetical protein